MRKNIDIDEATKKTLETYASEQSMPSFKYFLEEIIRREADRIGKERLEKKARERAELKESIRKEIIEEGFDPLK